MRQVGAHSYYLVDGVWVRDGFDRTFDIDPVEVGSAKFAALVEASPEIASAAALGGRVITLAADGTWIEVRWPDAGDGEVVVFELPEPAVDRDPVTAIAVSDPPASQQLRPPGDGSSEVGVPDLGDRGYASWLAILVGVSAVAIGGTAAIRIARR